MGVQITRDIEAMPKYSGGKQSLADDAKRPLKGFLAATEPFHNASETMTLESVRAFLLVAIEEGLDVNEYTRRSGVRQNVMSRHLLDLGPRDRYKEPGLGWVFQRQDPLDMRKHQYFLTDKGKALAHQLIRALGR